jgi:hypothetical protein
MSVANSFAKSLGIGSSYSESKHSHKFDSHKLGLSDDKSKLQRNDYVACVKPFCASPDWRLLRPEVPTRVVTLHYPEICNSHKATTTFLLGDKTFRVG